MRGLILKLDEERADVDELDDFNTTKATRGCHQTPSRRGRLLKTRTHTCRTHLHQRSEGRAMKLDEAGAARISLDVVVRVLACPRAVFEGVDRPPSTPITWPVIQPAAATV